MSSSFSELKDTPKSLLCLDIPESRLLWRHFVGSSAVVLAVPTWDYHRRRVRRERERWTVKVVTENLGRARCWMCSGCNEESHSSSKIKLGPVLLVACSLPPCNYRRVPFASKSKVESMSSLHLCFQAVPAPWDNTKSTSTDLEQTNAVKLATKFWKTTLDRSPSSSIMSQNTETPELTPQLCFNTTALRGES